MLWDWAYLISHLIRCEIPLTSAFALPQAATCGGPTCARWCACVVSARQKEGGVSVVGLGVPHLTPDQV